MIKSFALSLPVTKFKHVGVKWFKFLNLEDFSSKQVLQNMTFKIHLKFKDIQFQWFHAYFVFCFCEHWNEWPDRQIYQEFKEIVFLSTRICRKLKFRS